MSLMTIDENEDTNNSVMIPSMKDLSLNENSPLIDVAAFNRFWSSFNEPKVGKEVQLIVYRESTSLFTSGYGTEHMTIPKCKSNRIPVLKSVTVRSKTKVYKQKITVADTTTFTTLISFAVKVSPPPGKQFVIRAADGALEYMPDDLVREVILASNKQIL
ncbi:hypothetical protein GLOIN_2v1572339 [Rhizophagus clarus]|uniref:Uncharacterized protein n=1 Tax=Rhizophagus clarus TaxID=94130 RepID=A0A8H3KVM3_9GLOM|nr:hypothetical protein GLOIN_2v1572339 [Rhizophagus clarus]